MNAAPKPKPTPTQQRAANADKHPQIKLVPPGAPPLDDAAGEHSKAGQTTCGANRWYQGLRVYCELKPHHAGDHSQDGRSWRPRSGDE